MGTAQPWQAAQARGCPDPSLLTLTPAKGKLFWKETQENDLSLVSSCSHSDMAANGMPYCSILAPPAKSLW